MPCYSEPREGMDLLEGLGVLVARGIEGQPRAVARAGACAMACSFVATAASRSAIEAEQGRSEEEACCNDDGMGGMVSGACKRGTHGRAVLAGTVQRAAAGLVPLALP